MLVKRVVERKKVDSFIVGDQITVELAFLGSFTATAHRVNGQGTLFIFDECIVKKRMNEHFTNEGGFAASDLRRWMNETLVMLFPKKLKARMCPINDAGDLLKLPTYGQMFGHDDFYNEYVEPDNDDQLPLMQDRKNRVCDCGGDWCWYWLENAIKRETSSAYFCYVTHAGYAGSTSASDSNGVRPVFLIKKQ